MLAQHGRVSESTKQCFAHFCGVGAAAFGEQQRFGDRSDRAGDHHLIDELRKLAPAITDHVRAGLVMPGVLVIEALAQLASILAWKISGRSRAGHISSRV